MECSAGRATVSQRFRMDEVESVAVDHDGSLVILSRNVVSLQRFVPRLARDEGIRLLKVEPLDDSLESVFNYLVEA